MLSLLLLPSFTHVDVAKLLTVLYTSLLSYLERERNVVPLYIKVMNLQENTTTVLYYTITLCTYHLPREDDDDTSLFFVGDNDEPCREEEEEEEY